MRDLLARVARPTLFVFLLALLLSASLLRAHAQDGGGVVYVVQEGDNLWGISLRFGVSLADLMALNNLGEAGQVNVGDRLTIPGLEGMGVSGVLKTGEVTYGENLHSLSLKTGLSQESLARLNHLVSPAEIYAGMSLILLESEAGAQSGARPVLALGQSLLELAISRGVNPWRLVGANQFRGMTEALPGEVLWLPGEGAKDGPGGLPDGIEAITFAPLPAVQGATMEMQVRAEPGLSLKGEFTGRPLNFFTTGDSTWVALQGVQAMTPADFYPLSISGQLPGGEIFAFTQLVYVKAGGYPYDPTLIVSPETIDPAVTKPEDAQWAALTSPVSLEKYWAGAFVAPVPEQFAECFPSYFGSRRSYNDGPYNAFHTGLDFCGNEDTDVLAPAAGVVVFAGPLTVRGNATVIDHGWGVYTGYLHQSQLFVKAGERVEAGQVIGKVGATGRVTGPHLHWEIWVGGVQVDPLGWLEQEFPLDISTASSLDQ